LKLELENSTVSLQRIFFQAAKLAENFQREERVVLEIAFGQPARCLAQVALT
jgi:hypothetical protein